MRVFGILQHKLHIRSSKIMYILEGLILHSRKVSKIYKIIINEFKLATGNQNSTVSWQ
jgi:hypothetical protein